MDIKKKIKDILIKTNLQFLTKKISERINFIQHTKINGSKFIVPVVKNIGYDNLIFGDGEWKIDIFKKLLELKKGVFIDIGVNVGQTLLTVKSINNHVEYIGFEPNSNCVFYVNYLIKKNNFSGCSIIPIGLYNESKIIGFDVGNEADQSATVIENLRPGEQTKKIYVPVFKFDDVAKCISLQNVSVIKIDVEGAELNVLMGMEEFMTSKKPIIICEILWAHNEEKLIDLKERNEKTIEVIKKTGYLIFHIVKTSDTNTIESLKKISVIENKIYTVENREFCDYLLVHESDEKDIKSIFKIT